MDFNLTKLLNAGFEKQLNIFKLEYSEPTQLSHSVTCDAFTICTLHGFFKAFVSFTVGSIQRRGEKHQRTAASRERKSHVSV